MNSYFLKLSFLAALTSLFSACTVIEELVNPNEPLEDTSALYLIKQGEHETVHSYKIFGGTSQQFEVMFASTAIYKTKQPHNQSDINKLYGMSDCGGLHHTNSARFGWRWFNNQLELFAYSYKGGENTSTFLSTIELGKSYKCILTLEENAYVFEVNGKRIVHPRGCTGEGKGYQLYPYFGGDETAPHEIKIKIKELR